MPRSKRVIPLLTRHTPPRAFFPLQTACSRRESLVAFTLIELMLVVVIISSILVMSVPRFRSTFGDLRVRNFIHNLICLGYYARDKSILETKIYRINLDFSKNKFWLSYQDPVTKEFVRLNQRIVRIQSIPGDFKVQTEREYIDFYPDGTVDAVSISITKDNKKTYIINSDENTGILKFQMSKQ